MAERKLRLTKRIGETQLLKQKRVFLETARSIGGDQGLASTGTKRG